MSSNVMITYCPYCGTRHNRWGEVRTEGRPPKPDDVSICFACGEISLYDDRLDLRKPTDAEQEELRQDEDILMAREAWREVHR